MNIPRRLIIVKGCPVNFADVLQRHVVSGIYYSIDNSFLVKQSKFNKYIKTFKSKTVIFDDDVIIYHLVFYDDVKFVRMKLLTPQRLRDKSNKSKVVLISDDDDFKNFKHLFGLKSNGYDGYDLSVLGDYFAGYEMTARGDLFQLYGYHGVIYNTNVLARIFSQSIPRQLKHDEIHFYDVSYIKRVILLDCSTIEELPTNFEYRIKPKAERFFTDMQVYEIIPKPELYILVTDLSSNFRDPTESYKGYMLYIRNEYDLINALRKVGSTFNVSKSNTDKLLDLIEESFSRIFGGVEIKNNIGIIWNTDLIDSVKLLTPTNNKCLDRKVKRETYYKCKANTCRV